MAGDDNKERMKKRHPMNHISKFTLVTDTEASTSIEDALVILDRTDFPTSVGDINEKEQIEEEEKLLERVKNLVINRLVPKFSLLKCIPSEDLTCFEEYKDFNINDHVQLIRMKRVESDDVKIREKMMNENIENSIDDDDDDDGNDRKEKNTGDDILLKNTISDIISSTFPFGRSKPLWQVMIISNYSQGIPILFRIHHSLGDGATVQLMFYELCDHVDEMKKKKRPMIGIKKLVKGFLHTVLLPLYFIYQLFRLLYLVMCLCFVYIYWMYEVVKGKDPKTIYKLFGDSLSKEKRVDWTNKVKLSECKEIGKRHGFSTVNDIMLTVLAGALRRLMKKKDPETANKISQIRVAVPVNLRDVRKGFDAVHDPNKFGFFVTSIPLNQVDPVMRLEKIHKKMNIQKKYIPQPLVTYYTSFISNYLSTSFVKRYFTFLSDHITLVFTNARGFSEVSKLRMGGIAVKNVIGFVPPAFGVGIGVCVYSYDNHICMSLSINQRLPVHPSELVYEIDEEYKLLKAMSEAE